VQRHARAGASRTQQIGMELITVNNRAVAGPGPSHSTTRHSVVADCGPLFRRSPTRKTPHGPALSGGSRQRLRGAAGAGAYAVRTGGVDARTGRTATTQTRQGGAGFGFWNCVGSCPRRGLRKVPAPNIFPGETFGRSTGRVMYSVNCLNTHVHEVTQLTHPGCGGGRCGMRGGYSATPPHC
jgi:hypothetical protein